MNALVYIPAYALAALVTWLLWSHGAGVAIGVGLGAGFVLFVAVALLGEYNEWL